MIDQKIKQLREITSNFLFIEYYSHTDCDMYKILSEFTKYNEEKLALSPVDDGIEKALDLAIEHIGKKKEKFFNGEETLY